MENNNLSKEPDIKVSEYKNYKLIEFTTPANLDLYNVSGLKDIFKIGNSENVIDWIIDLSNIKFIDSSGLGTLTEQTMLLRKKSRKLIILSPSHGIKHIFNMGGLSQIFQIIYSLPEEPL